MAPDGGADTPARTVPARRRARGIVFGAVVGVGFAVALTVAGLGFVVAAVAGVGVGAPLYVASTRTRSATEPRMDPFTLSEPWRQLVIGAQRAASQLRRTVASVDAGPLHDRLSSITTRLEGGMREAWTVACRGDQIDAAVSSLDRPALESRRAAAERRAAPERADLDAELQSLDRQLASVERLREQSQQLEHTLRAMTNRFDELVVRATEVAVGTHDPEIYAHEVDDLLIELESLRLAAEETRDQ